MSKAYRERIMKLYLTFKNADQSEGRGWNVPTGAFTTANAALYYAYTKDNFYFDKQTILTLDLDNASGVPERYMTVRGEIVGDLEKNASWKDYLALIEELEAGVLPPVKLDEPQEVFALVELTERYIGTTKYTDVPVIDGIFSTEKAAYAAVELSNFDIRPITLNDYVGGDFVAEESTASKEARVLNQELSAFLGEKEVVAKKSKFEILREKFTS